MSHKEDQDCEAEALESIFPNEIEVLGTKPYHSFKFTLKTEKYDSDPYDEAKIILTFTFTKNYPDEIPEIIIDETENIRDENDVIEFLKKLAEENLGMPMIYTLVCALIEKLNKDNEIRKQTESDEKYRREQEREAEEMRKFEGTKVNVESFLKWKAAFDKEINELKKQEGTYVSKKVTGKQLFERDETLFNSDLKYITEDTVEVDESLFTTLDDLDIEDDGDEWVPGKDEDDDDDDDDDEDCEEEE